MNQKQAVKESLPEAKLGIFLCECETRIAPRVDTAVLAQLLDDSGVAHVETLPFSCLRPGFADTRQVDAESRAADRSL